MQAQRASRLMPWLWSLTTLVIVGGIVALGLWKLGTPPTTTATPVAATQPVRVSVDHDYYVFVRLIELNSLKPNGGNWDRGGNSAPDPYYRLFWHGTRIFESAAREDSLIASWDLFRVDVKDVLTNGGKFDVASAINAPLVRVLPNESLTIEVWDDDPMGDDLALKLEVQLDTLHPGENNITPESGSGVRRLVLQMIDRQTPLADLIELAARR